MFNVGDRVVYPMYGAGVIEGIETRDVDGQELSYYVLHIPIGDLKILISKSKADVLGLRALNSAEEVIDIVNNAEPIDMSNNWNLRYKENMAKLKGKQDSASHKKAVEKDEAKQIAEKLKTICPKLKIKTGENGKVFGGVTAKDIADVLNKEYKINIDKKKIDLKESIKTLGVTKVNVKLYEGVMGEIKIDVIPE